MRLILLLLQKSQVGFENAMLWSRQCVSSLGRRGWNGSTEEKRMHAEASRCAI